MDLLLDGIKVNYHQSGEGYPVVLLHGWGVSLEALTPVHQYLEKDFTVYSIDLPGFGKSTVPQAVWSVYDYAEFAQHFFAAMQIKTPIVIGHSFGGRLTIILGSEGLCSKIILVDSAGIRPKRGPDYYLRVYSYKAAKKVMSLPGLCRYQEKALQVWLKSNPSSDYKQAGGIMRQIFVRVVNEDLSDLLPKISVPTLLVWGENDTATPLSDAKLMEQKIPDSGLAVLKSAGHYSYLDQFGQFKLILDSFLAQEKTKQ